MIPLAAKAFRTRRLLLAATALFPLWMNAAQAQRDVLPGAIVGGILGVIQQQQQLQLQQQQQRQQQQIQQQIEADRQRAAADAQQRQQQDEAARQAAWARQQQAAAKAAADAKAKADAINRLRTDPIFTTVVGQDDRDISVLVAGQETANVTRDPAGQVVFRSGATACLPFGITATNPNTPEWRFLVDVEKQVEHAGGLAPSSLMVTACAPSELANYDLIIFTRAQVANGTAETLSPLVDAIRKRRFVRLATYEVARFQNPAANAEATAATTATPVSNTAMPVNTTTQTHVDSTVIASLTKDAAEARGMIIMLNTMIAEQRKLATDDTGQRDVAAQSIPVLETRAKEVQALFLAKTTQLSRYSTSIKPNDPDLQITPRKASENFLKVPYYIPGTPETGEFWIEPVVTDVGELTFNLRFIEPSSESDKTRESITLTVDQVEVTRKALVQVVKWANVAHDNHIRKEFTRRAACFPAEKCPQENGTKREGVSSTEIDFKIYEDGSTAGRIQRNKGAFEDGYNISIESASLLQAYFNYVLTEGKTDFEAGSRTEDQMRALFKPDS